MLIRRKRHSRVKLDFIDHRRAIAIARARSLVRSPCSRGSKFHFLFQRIKIQTIARLTLFAYCCYLLTEARTNPTSALLPRAYTSFSIRLLRLSFLLFPFTVLSLVFTLPRSTNRSCSQVRFPIRRPKYVLRLK